MNKYQKIDSKFYDSLDEVISHSIQGIYGMLCGKMLKCDPRNLTVREDIVHSHDLSKLKGMMASRAMIRKQNKITGRPWSFPFLKRNRTTAVPVGFIFAKNRVQYLYFARLIKEI